MGVALDVAVVGLLASPVAVFEGRPADGPRGDPLAGAGSRIELRAGLGVVGDRYFGRPAHVRASVTLIAAEALDAVAAELGVAPFDPLLTRRNIVLRGFPVDRLAAPRGGAGAVFSLDTGDGPVRLQAHRPAYPCAWMDQVLAPGAFRALRGRSGVRCAPLSDGVLRLGPGVLVVEQETEQVQRSGSMSG